MGILRLFLALTVLDWHYQFAGAPIFPFSFAAVACFFVISGFYMALILNEKYQINTGGISLFYANRLLRLYPTNIVILTVYSVFATAGFCPPFSYSFGSLADQVLIFPHVVVGNVLLRPGDNVLVFGPLYTVGLEIIFYAVAPFIVTLRLRYLAAILTAAACVHYGLHFAGLPSRPWQYEFFPGILYFFMLGAMAFRGLRLIRTWLYPRRLGLLTLPIFILYCAWVRPVSIGDFTNSWAMAALYVLAAVMIPFLFEATRDLSWDRFVGDLSYPLYASHMAVGLIIAGKPPGPDHASLTHTGVLLGSLAVALALSVGVERPVDRLRERFFKRIARNNVSGSPSGSQETA